MIETILKGINNRDIASFFWVVVVSLFLIIQSIKTKSNLLNTVKDVFVAASQYKIIIIFFILLINTLLSVYVLTYLDLWDFSQTKNTFLWLIVTGLAIIGKSFSSDNYKNLLNETILTNLKLTIFLEFFINLYVFSLPIEIFLVFITSILVILSVFSENKNEVNELKAHQFLNTILSAIGILLFIITTYKFIENPDNFLNPLTLLNLITPINLTLLSLPSILILFIIKSYEDFFTYYNYRLEHSTEAKEIKIAILRRINFKIDNLNKLRTLVASKNLLSLTEIHETINFIEKQKKLKANPPLVLLRQGWSPYLASNFLEKQRIQCSFYKAIDNEEWFASSNSYELSNPFNNIFYYISGTEVHVTRLSLKLSVSDVSTKDSDLDSFCSLISQLYFNATFENIEDIILSKVSALEDFQINYEYYTIYIETTNYINNNGFSVSFIMKNHNHIN